MPMLVRQTSLASLAPGIRFRLPGALNPQLLSLRAHQACFVVQKETPCHRLASCSPMT
jgi:hypothetical protein